MECPHCQSKHLVKNGCSRHGKQRWLCRKCR
ncbi:MAG: IS1 family transposase, partial [Chthoniobacterales bacterium]